MTSKYHNIKTELDGYTFDSKKEARRYQDLVLLEKAGEIRDLIVKPEPYSFDYQGVHICKYHPDFQYRENTKKRDMSYLVVEDVKGGPRTPVYRIKAKLMMAFYNIKVREIQ